MTRIIESPSHDPYWNLALEEHLLGQAEEPILYLWQNAHTVVIGKNQNPWKECDTTLLEQEGGRLARRLSGGGAVYHDLGNLNFTILLPQDRFDLGRQFSVIVQALRTFGLEAEISGRNDLTLDGRKFSGNAFYKNGTRAYHHGTLLVDVDREKMGRYLTPSPGKLRAKGVDSVRSRVVNLRELNPEITVDSLKNALKSAFFQVYGAGMACPAPEVPEALTRRYGSWDWIYGQKLPFTWSRQIRFPWGAVELELQVESGVVQTARVYADAMDWTLAPRLEAALPGCRFFPGDLIACAAPIHPDLTALF